MNLCIVTCMWCFEVGALLVASSIRHEEAPKHVIETSAA